MGIGGVYRGKMDSGGGICRPRRPFFLFFERLPEVSRGTSAYARPVRIYDMRKTLLIAIATVAATCAFAKTPTKATKTPTTIKCAVTGGNVNIAKATKNHMFADYKGHRYFFCCAGCPEEFAKNPAKYQKADSIPTPKK